MWQTLTELNWPTDGYYWVRKKVTVEKWIVQIERDVALFPGTSLRNMRQKDYDIGQWEIDTAGVVQVETAPPYLPFLI